jgi:alanine racemase
MHRLGFEENEIDELCSILIASNIKVASIFSHLVGADSFEHDGFTKSQVAQFERIFQKIEALLGYNTLKHILNSAGITRWSNHQYDMVRLGIGLYGVESPNHPSNMKLQNVSTLKTVISQIRDVKKGDTIGYSRKGRAKENYKIATLAIGYADGYSRKFSNGVGMFLVNGKLAPVIGNVCMDMCMINISGINVEEGNEVIVFGEHLTVNQLAQWGETIPYEILTNVSERVKRVFFLD